MRHLDQGKEVIHLKGLRPGFLALLIGLLIGACSSSSNAPAPASNGAVPSAPAAISSTANPEYSGFLAASEFVIGQNRFPFALLSVDGTPLEHAQVQVRFSSLKNDVLTFQAESEAQFREVRGITPHSHEDGSIHKHVESRGVYVVDQVTLNEPGIWIAEFTVTGPESVSPMVQGLAFQVVPESGAPRMGDPVPPSRNPIAPDVVELAEITTHHPPLPGLYQLTVAQALEEGKPFVVTFSTPMFCTSRMCGPVTDVVAGLYERHRDQVNFIHIEPFDLIMARNEGRLVPTEVFLEWNLPSEPWVFVAGEDGRVVARFEGLVSSEELEASIAKALNEAPAS